MRMLIVLVLVWLAGQYLSLGLSGRLGGHREGALHPRRIAAVLDSWPSQARRTAERMILELGPPDGVFDEQLRWSRDGQMAVVLYREDVRRHQTTVLPAGVR